MITTFTTLFRYSDNLKPDDDDYRIRSAMFIYLLNICGVNEVYKVDVKTVDYEFLRIESTIQGYLPGEIRTDQDFIDGFIEFFENRTDIKLIRI